MRRGGSSGLAEAVRGPGWVPLHHGQLGGRTRGWRQFHSDIVVGLDLRLRNGLSPAAGQAALCGEQGGCLWGSQEGARGLGWGRPGLRAMWAGCSPQGSPRPWPRASTRVAQGGPSRPGGARSAGKSGSWGFSAFVRGRVRLLLLLSPPWEVLSESLERSLGALKGHTVKWS